MIIVSELKAEMNKKDSDTDKKRTRSESEESEPNKNLLFRGFVKIEDFFFKECKNFSIKLYNYLYHDMMCDHTIVLK